MKRRTFLKSSSMAAAPMLLGGVQVSALNNPFFNILNNDDDRVLVLIQLDGGNDGLNMIFPKDQYAGLVQARENILIPENEILDLTPTVGVHPVMGSLKNVFDEGKLNIIQSVGYPNQNRSHFRSTDIWATGSSAEDIWTTGWLGRYLDLLHPNYPTGFPNPDFPHPFAITIGSSVSPTCEGLGGNFSMALVNPDNLTDLAVPVNGSLTAGCYSEKLQFLTDTIIQTNAYNDVIETANDLGNNLSVKYSDFKLSNKLRLIARLISGGLQTKVFVVHLGGFDTHAEQVDGASPSSGEHASLLQELSYAIDGFQDDLQLLGLDDRVIGMTFSEFGRQIRSNDSLGTDHGTAAPLMVFGSCVNPEILGDNPQIPNNIQGGEGVPMQFDFRSVYGSILMDWFGVDELTVKELLYDDFQHLPILDSACVTEVPVNTSNIEADNLEINAFPNPFSNTTTIEFTIKSGWVKISLFDVIGSELKVLTNQKFTTGTHQVQMEGHDLAAGSYYYRIQTDYGQKTKRLIKVR